MEAGPSIRGGRSGGRKIEFGRRADRRVVQAGGAAADRCEQETTNHQKNGEMPHAVHSMLCPFASPPGSRQLRTFMDLKSEISDLRFQIPNVSDPKSQISNLRFQILVITYLTNQAGSPIFSAPCRSEIMPILSSLPIRGVHLYALPRSALKVLLAPLVQIWVARLHLPSCLHSFVLRI